jgi:predicted Zn-dependent protease
MRRTLPLFCLLIALASGCQPAIHKQLYFVPIGQAPMNEVQDFIVHYRTKFGIESRVLQTIKLDASDFDPSRSQLVAENAIETMLQAYPEYAKDRNAVLIGITSLDMYPKAEPDWAYCYGWRVEYKHAAIVSTSRMIYHFPDEVPSEASLQKRLRKAVTKYVGILYFGKPANDNPRSVLYDDVKSIEDLDRMSEDF